MIGVESAFSFGDALFNIPLIKSISEKYNCQISVATQKQYKDAFFNIPFIGEIIEIAALGHGMEIFRNHPKYAAHFQITQFTKFHEFKSVDPEHSLIDTPSLIGQSYGFTITDPRPIFMPYLEEISSTKDFESGPYIAIESEARSGQSWADKKAIDTIIARYQNTHRILWLSNQDPPDLDCIIDLIPFSRRQAIMCMRHAETFYSVGSGFFCAALALPNHYQPKRIRCLWIDEQYKYERRLSREAWHPDIAWIHNHQELSDALL